MITAIREETKAEVVEEVKEGVYFIGREIEFVKGVIFDNARLSVVVDGVEYNDLTLNTYRILYMLVKFSPVSAIAVNWLLWDELAPRLVLGRLNKTYELVRKLKNKIRSLDNHLEVIYDPEGANYKYNWVYIDLHFNVGV